MTALAPGRPTRSVVIATALASVVAAVAGGVIGRSAGKEDPAPLPVERQATAPRAPVGDPLPLPSRTAIPIRPPG